MYKNNNNLNGVLGKIYSLLSMAKIHIQLEIYSN